MGEFERCFSCGLLRKYLKKGKCIFCRKGYGGKTKEISPSKEDIRLNRESINKYEDTDKFKRKKE